MLLVRAGAGLDDVHGLVERLRKYRARLDESLHRAGLRLRLAAEDAGRNAERRRSRRFNAEGAEYAERRRSRRFNAEGAEYAERRRKEGWANPRGLGDKSLPIGS